VDRHAERHQTPANEKFREHVPSKRRVKPENRVREKKL